MAGFCSGAFGFSCAAAAAFCMARLLSLVLRSRFNSSAARSICSIYRFVLFYISNVMRKRGKWVEFKLLLIAIPFGGEYGLNSVVVKNGRKTRVRFVYFSGCTSCH
jgi:hypothetical protein